MPPKDRDARETTSPVKESGAAKAVHTPPTFADPEPHHHDSFDESDLSPSEVREREKPPELRRATAADLSRVENRVSEYIDTDAREHKEIRDDMQKGLKELSTKLDANLTTRDAKLDAFGTQLGQVAVQSAVTAAHAERLVAVVDSQSQAELRLKTAQQEAAIADITNAKKFKRDLTIKIAGWMTPIAAALVALIVGLIEKCK